MSNTPKRARSTPGNPEGSRWRTTAEADRGRKRFTITLEPDTIARIDEAASSLGMKKSHFVEEAVLTHYKKPGAT